MPLLDLEQQQTLLSIARQSIEQGLADGHPLEVDLSRYATALHEWRASFVTLHHQSQLRGCIGHLEAYQPLAVDVAENAYSAAFRDPRFSALQAAELAALQIHISVLTPPEPMSFSDQGDLMRQIRPGIDGLILQAEGRRGTFLPSVWESLPEPLDFLRQLKRKAGLSTDYWSRHLVVERYTTESFGEDG